MQKAKFEDNLNDLEVIVKKLENGDIPLEESLEEFKKGIELTQSMQKELSEAQDMIAKLTIEKED